MALADQLGNAGYNPIRINTIGKVYLEKAGEGFGITKIELKTEAEVQDIDEATFLQIAERAKIGYPVSRALASVPEITLDAKLL